MAARSRFESLADAAERYGRLSLDNYAQIRNLAETIQVGFCRYLGGGERICAHLVPADGPWEPQNYQSGAFSVSGTGFLPLEPISFGLAVRVSRTGDWIRLGLRCAKAGQQMEVEIQGGRTITLGLPATEAQIVDLFDHLLAHLTAWFAEHADRYEHGDYGQSGMGFDFLHRAEA